MVIYLATPAEVALDLAHRVRARRLQRGWTQSELAKRAGVALSTLKVFEHRGQISIVRLLRIAAATGDLGSFEKVFEPQSARNLAEIEARAAGSTRKYGRSILAKKKTTGQTRKSTGRRNGPS